MENVKSATIVKKGRDGWEAKTDVKIKNACDYEIHTFKYSGGFVKCSAQAGTKKEPENGLSSFSYMMFSDPNYKLASNKVRATEKSISEIHAAGLLIFDQKLKAGELTLKVAEI